MKSGGGKDPFKENLRVRFAPHDNNLSDQEGAWLGPYAAWSSNMMDGYVQLVASLLAPVVQCDGLLVGTYSM